MTCPDTDYKFTFAVCLGNLHLWDLEGYAALEYHHGNWKLGGIYLYGTVANESQNAGALRRLSCEGELKPSDNPFLAALHTTLRLWLLSKEQSKQIDAHWDEHLARMKREKVA